MTPFGISEDKVTIFKYWNNGIQEGMNHKGELYALVRSYPADSQLSADELAGDLAEKGIQVCLTSSPSRYGVWINLKSVTVGSDQNLKVPVIRYI